MARTAFNLCWDVIKLPGQCNTGVMAGCTITAHYSHVVDKSVDECSKADVNGVAGRTVFVRRYMTQRLACADITVMAGQAVAGICAGVVKRRTSKSRSVMAHGAILVVGSGRYVVRQFTDTGHIIVAGITAAHERRAGMIKGASAKGARGVTNTAILSGRHVLVERGGKRHTARRPRAISNMTGGAIVHEVGMIDERSCETIRVMARSAIVRGSRVGGYRRCFSGRVNTIVIIVA